MTKAEKLKAYKVFVDITLSAHCIVEAFGGQTPEEASKTERRKRILKKCQNELDRSECSVLKVENLFIEMVNED